MRAAIGRRFAAAAGGLPGVFWTMWWGLIVNRLASFVIAFLSIYLVRERGLRPAEAGRIVALYGLGFTVAGPLSGLLADRIGRRATMVAGLVLRGRARLRPHPGAACPLCLPLRRDGRSLSPGHERRGGRRGLARRPAPRVRPRVLGGEPRPLGRPRHRRAGGGAELRGALPRRRRHFPGGCRHRF